MQHKSHIYSKAIFLSLYHIQAQIEQKRNKVAHSVPSILVQRERMQQQDILKRENSRANIGLALDSY